MASCGARLRLGRALEGRWRLPRRGRRRGRERELEAGRLGVGVNTVDVLVGLPL